MLQAPVPHWHSGPYCIHAALLTFALGEFCLFSISHKDTMMNRQAKKRQANVKTLKAELLSCTQVKIPDVMFALQDLLSDQPGSLDTRCRSTDMSPFSVSPTRHPPHV